MYTTTEIGRIAPHIINKIEQAGVACLMLHFESADGADGMFGIAMNEVFAQHVSYKSLAMIITLDNLNSARLRGWNDTILYLLGCAAELNCDSIKFI